MLTYLITGGAGFIGSHYIQHLYERYGDTIAVVNVDKLTYAGNLKNLQGIDANKNYSFIQEDIASRPAMLKLFGRFHPDVVVNFAAETHVDRSIKEPGVFFHTNLIGLQILCDTVLEYPVKKLIHISTDEVYGSLGGAGSFTEHDRLNPSSPYAASKAGGDLLLGAYGKTYGLPYCITRCSNNYGPRQYPEKLIPMVISRYLRNESIPVYGRGDNVRDWIWVKDHCRAIDTVIQHGREGEIYNIGGGCEVSNLTMVNMIVEEITKQLESIHQIRNSTASGLIQLVQDRPGHDFRYALNSTKIRRELGWSPQTTMEEGLEKTITWYLHNWTI